MLEAKISAAAHAERQMLVIGRALCAPQRLILLDEPFEGLAPSVVAEVLAATEQLRHETSILLVEHKVDMVLGFADRVYIMVSGQIACSGESHALRDDVETQRNFLGVRTLDPVIGDAAGLPQEFSSRWRRWPSGPGDAGFDGGVRATKLLPARGHRCHT